MTLNKRLALVGYARQTGGFDAPEAAPTFEHGLTEGKVAAPEITEDDLNTTSSSPMLEDVDRTVVQPQANFTAVAMPKPLGLLLYGALGAIATTGGAAPYSHEITVDPNGALPYLTLFGKYDTALTKVEDARVSELELIAQSAGALRMRAALMGCDFSFPAGPIVAGEVVKPGGGRLVGNGGTATIDGSGARITAATVTIATNLQTVPTITRITPEDITPAMIAITLSLTLVPDDITDFRKTLTGSAGGTTIAATPREGAVGLTFVQDVDTDLVLTMPRVNLLSQFPDADPAGGHAEVEVAGKVLVPTGGAEPITATLRNAIDAY